AWNTVGAIAGAVAAGYFLLPRLHFGGTAALAAGVSLALAGAAAVAKPRRPAVIGVAVAGGLALAALPIPEPWALLRHHPLSARAAAGEPVFYGVGRSATVVLFESGGEWRLTTNGLPESAIESPGFRPGRHVVARWLSLLPIALRPQTDSLLAVGFGAGVTVENLPPSVRRIHVIELEPEVIRANRRLAARRRLDPLADPRLTLHLGDARGALQLAEGRFDAVVSQPSHPWTSGAANLYTREFFDLVRRRLGPDGIFVQWMGLRFVDESLLRSLVATAADVFPHVEVYQPQPGAILIAASEQPMELRDSAPRALEVARGQWRELGVLRPHDLEAARLLDDGGARRFAAAAPLITDARNLLRMHAPAAMRRPVGPAAARLLADFEPAPDPLDPEPIYRVRRLIRQGSRERARRVAASLQDAAARQTAVALTAAADGHRRAAEAGLRRALALDPRQPEATAALLALAKPRLFRGFDPPADLELTPELRTVAEGWRLSAAADWPGVRRLEERLARLSPGHRLYPEASRLRARWRLWTRQPARLEEAQDLVLPLLAPDPRPEDLLLRARIGLAAGEPGVALAAIGEALAARHRPQTARQARALLSSVEPTTEWHEAWRDQLAATF
ncbi:MAG: fused MFS/spermidine synthase, partial [Acidobacteriota bacterium]